MPKWKEESRFILQKDHEWRNEFLFTSRLTQNRDFDVNGFLRSSPNPVVASTFGDAEIIQRAPLRRENFVMKSWFLNLGDDVYDQAIRERITVIVHRTPSPTVGSGISKPRTVAHSQLCHLE